MKLTEKQEKLKTLLLYLTSPGGMYGVDAEETAEKIVVEIAPEEKTARRPCNLRSCFEGDSCACHCHDPRWEPWQPQPKPAPEPEKPKDILDSRQFSSLTLHEGELLKADIRRVFRPDYDQLKAREARYREALEKIATIPCQSIHQGCGGCLSCIARAALKESD